MRDRRLLSRGGDPRWFAELHAAELYIRSARFSKPRRQATARIKEPFLARRPDCVIQHWSVRRRSVALLLGEESMFPEDPHAKWYRWERSDRRSWDPWTYRRRLQPSAGR